MQFKTIVVSRNSTNQTEVFNTNSSLNTRKDRSTLLDVVPFTVPKTAEQGLKVRGGHPWGRGYDDGCRRFIERKPWHSSYKFSLENSTE